MKMQHEQAGVSALSGLAVVLLLTASLAGLLFGGGGSTTTFTSQRGEAVQIYGGQNVYRYDNVYKAVAFRSFNLVDLAVVLPLLALGWLQYRRGQIRGRLLLASVFAYLAYIYLIGVMGNAFNALFLVWTALYSLGLFGLAILLAGVDRSSLPASLAADFPRRGLAIYMLALGAILLIQYLAEVLAAYRHGAPPVSLDHYTTLELAALELGIMIPLHFVAGALLWKQQALGTLIAIPLAFAASMTFLALSISALLFYFAYGQGGVADMAITLALALLASGISWRAYTRIKA
jgi:hypothetical protein